MPDDDNTSKPGRTDPPLIDFEHCIEETNTSIQPAARATRKPGHRIDRSPTTKTDRNPQGSGRKRLRFTKEIASRAYEIAQTERRNYVIAQRLGISNWKFIQWMRTYPQLANAVSLGKSFLYDDVEEKMYQLANGEIERKEHIVKHNSDGSTTSEERTRRFAPDFNAASFILRNARPETWNKDKSMIDLDIGVQIVEAPMIQKRDQE